MVTFTLGYMIALVIIPLCFTVSVSLIIMQFKSFKLMYFEQNLIVNKCELFCIFGQYSMGALCAVFCLFLHSSYHILPDYLCKYGLGSCLVIYAGSKACLYGFFVERAKTTQGIVKLLPNYVWQYVFPIYISCYFIMFLILCSIAFRGTIIDPTGHATSCILYAYKPQLFTLHAAVDFLNCILFLCLFIYPIYHLEKEHIILLHLQRQSK